MSRRPENKTPKYYFDLADDAANNHRYSSAVTSAAKGLALFPSVRMNAPQMQLAAEYRQKRAEWMQDAAKCAENLLKTDMANDPLPDASIGLAFPQEFKIWKSATPDIRLDILERSPTPAGQYKRLAVCMVTIRDDLKKASERARMIEAGENERRSSSVKGPRVPSEKEFFKALNARKAAMKRRIGIS